jgi:signal transduction histidine kinase
MRISDNGIGFSMDKVKDGIGLSNMRRRAQLFSGEFHVNSSQGKGCEILISIPVVKSLTERPLEELKK